MWGTTHRPIDRSGETPENLAVIDQVPHDHQLILRLLLQAIL